MVMSFVAAVMAGILMSQGARVWLLFVVVLAATTVALTGHLAAGAGIAVALESAVIIGVVIQIGYALGLFGRALVFKTSAFRAEATSLRRH